MGWKKVQGGENAARITPAIALPIPLTIAAARLGLDNGTTGDVPVSLRGLMGGGGSLGGPSLLKAERIVREQF